MCVCVCRRLLLGKVIVSYVDEVDRKELLGRRKEGGVHIRGVEVKPKAIKTISKREGEESTETKPT